jgi:HemY protein
MIKALWFMTKIGLLALLAVWIAGRPGFVRLEWLDYAFTVHVGLFLLMAMFTILLAIFVYSVIRTIAALPRTLRQYREKRRREKGYRALTRGLTAVAAGDVKTAVHEAERASSFLKGEDNSLSLLLEAQAARLDRREDDARRSFVKLLAHKDAAFLGVRGLLQAALDTHDYARALDLARQALKLHPKQPWILRLVYDLELRQRQWARARDLLGRAQRAGAVPPEKATRDRVAMLLAEADDDLQKGLHEEALKKTKKAARTAPGFVPASLRLARLYIQAGQRRQAIHTLERAWKAAPHPAYVPLWQALIAPEKTKKPVGRLQWFEKLLTLNPDTAAGQMAAGQIAMEDGLWGEARHFLMRTEEIEPSADLYKLRAELETRASNDPKAAQDWLEKAATAKTGKAWVCRESGRIYEEWIPVALPHGSFNTIEWSSPDFETRPAENSLRAVQLPG